MYASAVYHDVTGMLLPWQPSLEEKRQRRRRERLKWLARVNRRHADVKPVYGEDFCEAMSALQQTRDSGRSRWRSLGMAHCRRVQLSRRHAAIKNDVMSEAVRPVMARCEKTSPQHPAVFWRQTRALEELVRSPLQYLDELHDILSRYLCVNHSVSCCF